jgi:hypothetical protein
VREALRRRKVRVELRFRDGAKRAHVIKSAAVPGGKMLFDESASWGLRALGLCGGEEEDGHLRALADDYAARCGDETKPVCRRLTKDDITRGREAERAESGR